MFRMNNFIIICTILSYLWCAVLAFVHVCVLFVRLFVRVERSVVNKIYSLYLWFVYEEKRWFSRSTELCYS